MKHNNNGEQPITEKPIFEQLNHSPQNLLTISYDYITQIFPRKRNCYPKLNNVKHNKHETTQTASRDGNHVDIDSTGIG